MPAQTRPRIKRHEPEWFRFGGIDHFPDIYAHRRVNLFQFIREGDVHTAKYIFEQLSGFRGAAGRNRHDRLNSAAIQRIGAFQASRAVASNDFRNDRNFAVRVARVFPFG